MLLHHCISLWLCSAAVQGLGVYLMYIVRSHYSPTEEKAILDQNSYADLIEVPRPMVPGPFGTLIFPQNDDSYMKSRDIYNGAYDDEKTDESTPPSLLRILAGPVGLYIICSFTPLIVLSLVVLCLFFRGREPARHLRSRPVLVDNGIIPYQQLQPAMGPMPLRRRTCPRIWG